jgi:uncharacterized membrane protein YraQ (UPF0718 family)
MKQTKEFIKKYGIIIIFGVFVGVSRLLPVSHSEAIRKNFFDFLREMLTFLPCMFVLIGLFDVWVPKETIQKHTGEASGMKGTLVVILLAMLQAGPLYGAFPVAAILWKKGCSLRNIFIYLGAFSTLKIPMLAFEIGFLGLKFSVLRTLITLPVFFAIAEIMASYLRHQDFTIKQIEE